MKSLTAFKGSKIMLMLAGSLPMAIAFSGQAADYSDYKENGWSAGMNIGKSSASVDSATIRASLENNGFGVNSIAADNSNIGYKVFIGYQAMPYIKLEGGYFDLGDFSFFADTLPVTNFTGSTQLKGWNLDLVGTLPLTERFSAFARIGVTRNDTETRATSNGLVNTAHYNQNDDDTQHKFGVGLQYDVSTAFTVRLEAERYRMDDLVGNDGDIDLYSLGLMYRFGNTAQRYVATPAPEPVAVRAPVQRAPAATSSQPAKPAAEVLVLQDVHFNFDTAELNADTKQILRRHVRTLKANPAAKVRIAGYTSASGTKEYNQALSERRARAIEVFLVAEGVAANRLKTIGFGQSNPAEYEARPSELHSDAANANMRGLFEIIVE